MPKTIVLELDDYAMSNLPFDQLIPLKDHFPNLKVTLFTIPFDPNLQKHQTLDKFMEWAELTKKFSDGSGSIETDWIEIAVHGLMHTWEEFQVSKELALARLTQAENMLHEFPIKKKRKYWTFGPERLRMKTEIMKPHIPYEKIFRAPRWQYSMDAFEVLRDRGYVVCTDRNQPQPNVPGMETYVYNWSIEEEFPGDLKVIKGHGHIRANMANDIDRCYQNLLKMPTDANFLKVSEYVAQRGSKNN